MKRAKRCGECGGTDIRTTVVSSGGGHAPDLLPGAHSRWKSGKLEIFVCAACGHFQFFVPEDLLPNVLTSKKFKVFF